MVWGCVNGYQPRGWPDHKGKTTGPRWPPFVRRLIEITSRHQTQRTLLDWLRLEYAIEKPSDKFFAAAELNSDARKRWILAVESQSSNSSSLANLGGRIQSPRV
jgi:hypothetical protein